MKHKIMVGIILFLFYGCEKESNPCEIAKEGENYILSDSAKTFVSNYVNADRIIFKSLAGDEVSFDIIENDTIGSYQVGFPCEIDTLQNQTTKGASQILTYSLINNEVISEPIIVSLFEFPETPARQSQETFGVSLGEYFSNSFEEGDELFYYILDSNNSHLNYLDSLEIGGKTFYSIYEMSNLTANSKFEIKYSLNEGIIYMKDLQSLVEYIYERKE